MTDNLPAVREDAEPEEVEAEFEDDYDEDPEPGVDEIAIWDGDRSVVVSREPDLDAIAQAHAEVARLSREAQELAAKVEHVESTPTTGTDMVLASKATPATAVRAQMAELRAEATRKQVSLKAAQKELERVLKVEMEKAYQILDPLQEMVKRLEEGIWTVNLYLGREEEIVCLADGEPAPADTPIALRQLVLGMDEETAIAAEDGGIDARNIDEFDDWLMADPAHLTQVLPETKGVVVLQPRLQGKQYDEPWEQMQMDVANKQSYWLIRNGEKVYRMTTDFHVGRRLIPNPDEFADLFWDKRYNWDTREYDKVRLEPGSDEWLKAEDKADARQRHYMRVALILQGLIDRTTVFHPLPAESVNMLQSESFLAGYVRMIADDDESRQLLTSRTPYYEWLRGLNAQLRPGMRIIGSFHGREFWGTREYDEGRLYPRTASKPQDGVIYTIERRNSDGSMTFLYKRTDKVWKEMPAPGRPGYVRNQDVEPAKRASCTIYDGDRFIIPIDLVSIPELEAYLTARTERHAYADSFPLMKSAIAALQAEAEEEKDFRTLLAGELIRTDADLSQDEAYAKVDELVRWWKFANRWHRPLVGKDVEAKAVRMIRAEYISRKKAEESNSGNEAEMVDRLRHFHPKAMLIARRRNGTYVVLTPHERAFPDGVVPHNVFYTEHTYTATGKPKADKTVEWRMHNPTVFAKWRVLYSTDVWEGWDLTALPTQHLTDPDIISEVDRMMAKAEEFSKAHRGPGYYRNSADIEYPDRPGKVATVTYDEDRKAMQLWFVPLAGPTIPDNLLTGKVEHAKMYRISVYWHGRAGQPDWQGGSRMEETTEHYHRSPWESKEVVYRSPDGIALYEEHTAAVKDAFDRERRMDEIVARAMESIKKQWLADWEKAQYAKFLEDYADPELWEGHRKSLKEPTYPEPPGAVRRWSHFDNEPEGIWLSLSLLVENGVDVDGMTLTGVLNAARRYHGPADATFDEALVNYRISLPKGEVEVWDDDD